MAMLAEPRSRKRYNLCPRGKALYEDDSRFGTKMLEKWGWEKGRGLGANEDGEQEFVRVRFKNDAEGLGFEARDDQWTTHEEGFNGLLKTLNGEENQPNGSNGASESEDEMRTVGFGFKTEPQASSEDAPQKLKEKISGVSLEEKSKHSKARVHYKKFTRGKDLSQYSEKDLANIFGKKVNEELKKKEEPEDKEVNPNFSGVHTLSTGLSVQDYFKQKMEAIKKRLQNRGDQKEEKQLEESNDGDEKDGPQIEEETGFKKNRRSKKIEENVGLEEPVDAGTEKMVKKKEKKSKKSKEIEEFTEELLKEPLTKKKKSKKSKEIQDEVIRTEEIKEICKEPEESVEKKKKSKKIKETPDEEVIRTKEMDAICKETEESNEKKKKSKKLKETSEKEVHKTKEMEDICKETEDTVKKKSRKTKEILEEAPLIEESLKKKKKSKKQKELELEIQEQVTEETQETVVPIPEESNKKKQKKLKLDSVINSPEIQEPQETVVPTSEESYKKKQKLTEEPIPEVSFKKKSKKQTENNEIQDQVPFEPHETVVPISEESFKKKSKKRKENIEQKQPEDTLETVEPLSEDVSKKKKKSQNSIAPSTTQKASKKKRDFDTTDHLALEPALKKLKKSLDETLDQPTQPVSLDPNSSSSDEASIEDKNLLSLEQLNDKLNSFNIFTISSFCAEKFHLIDMYAFNQANLAELLGYGISDKIQLNVVELMKDAKRITDLWQCKSDSYQLKKTKKPNIRYPVRVIPKTIRAVKKRQIFTKI